METRLHLVLGSRPDPDSELYHVVWQEPDRAYFTATMTLEQVHSAVGAGLAIFDIHDPVISLAGWSGRVSALADEAGAPSDLWVMVYDRPTADVRFVGVELVESLAINAALVTRRPSHGAIDGTRPVAHLRVPQRLRVSRRLWDAGQTGSDRLVRVALAGPGGADVTFKGGQTRSVVDGLVTAGLVPLGLIPDLAERGGLLGLTPEVGFSGAGGGVDSQNDLHAPSTWPAVGGAGEAVMVLDGGFNAGTKLASFIANAVVAKVQLPYWNGYVGDGGRVETRTAATDETGHATMVAAVIAGRRPSDWANLPDGVDPHGIAPEAKLVMVSLGRNRETGAPLPGPVAQFDDTVSGTDAPPRLVVDEVGITRALSEGQQQGVKAWIGCMAFEGGLPTTDTGYDATCAEVDAFVYSHRKTLLVTAAGNVRGAEDEGPIRAPGAAKNVLTVGAFAATEGDIGSGRKETTDVERGTTSWSRAGAAAHAPGVGSIGVKPDVVAPGANVMSYRSAATRVWDAGQFPAAARESYAFFNGSSVACALTAGVVANVRSRLVQAWDGVEPTAAALKALFILGAAAPDAPKVSELMRTATRMRAAARPNQTKGWGRVDVRRMLVSSSGHIVKVLDGVAVGASPLVIPLGSGLFDGERAVVASLVWTDPPSLCLGGGWVAQYAMALFRTGGPQQRCVALPYVTGAQVVAASFDPADGEYELRVYALTKEALGGQVAVALSGAMPTDADQEWRTA